MSGQRGQVLYQSDVDFAMFLTRLTPSRVRRERFVQTIPDTLTRQYDNETEKQRLLISGQTKGQAA